MGSVCLELFRICGDLNVDKNKTDENDIDFECENDPCCVFIFDFEKDYTNGLKLITVSDSAVEIVIY